MTLTGGCYCGALRYELTAEPVAKGQCHCRECQYISGGAPNLFMALPPEGFQYTKGSPKTFRRADLETPVTREFCAECGTHVATRPVVAPMVIVKVGTLDDPAAFGGPAIAIFTSEAQPFHHIAEGVKVFEGMVGG